MIATALMLESGVVVVCVTVLDAGSIVVLMVVIFPIGSTETVEGIPPI